MPLFAHDVERFAWSRRTSKGGLQSLWWKQQSRKSGFFRDCHHWRGSHLISVLQFPHPGCCKHSAGVKIRLRSWRGGRSLGTQTCEEWASLLRLASKTTALNKEIFYYPGAGSLSLSSLLVPCYPATRCRRKARRRLCPALLIHPLVSACSRRLNLLTCLSYSATCPFSSSVADGCQISALI